MIPRDSQGRVQPFVLLDDARALGASRARLYCDPIETLECRTPEDVRPALERLKSGHWAGFVSYEAGQALEPKLCGLRQQAELPLLWFGRFERHVEIDPADVAALLPDPDGAWAAPPRPEITRRRYDAAMEQVLSLISAGDIYQANLTFQSTVAFSGDPLALYAGLRQRAGAGYGGVIWTGSDWLLSLSPELFFALRDGKITTKPMKGTATRGATPEDDKAAAQELLTDPKQRAENLMIVDLLRNDLSRISVSGTVEVPHLFAVETYPTVHQMTSTVTAQVSPGKKAADILAAIFPCGSITGAPKIRAMEVIDEIEHAPRGIYTGVIGRIDASGDAAFNVAIRTLHIPADAAYARLGLGSGIVADSNAPEEWAECLAKGKFVADPRRFDLIETMRFDPGEGIALLDLHMARIGSSARELGFSFDRHAARNALQSATFRLDGPHKVRLRLAQGGDFAIETSALPLPPAGPVEIAVVALPVVSGDFRLRHKTSERSFYDDARNRSVTFEVLFRDAEGFLTEGSFTNIFLERAGQLLTPPARRGLLPGILRAHLIETGRATEADLEVRDLADGFFIGNALRGLMPARLG